jgi:hypothetical protein
MRIKWELGERVRCDLFAFAAINLDGKKSLMRMFPTGSRKGRIETEEMRSIGIRTPIGTRVVLITHPGDDWEKHPWRCIRMMEGNVMPPGEGRLPGIRIPDLDLLDSFKARKTDTDFQSSYDFVERIEDGSSWTFGRGGGEGLKGKVRLIRVEREELAATTALETEGNLAMLELAKRHIQDGGDIRDTVKAQLVDGGLTPAQADTLMAEHL